MKIFNQLFLVVFSFCLLISPLKALSTEIKQSRGQTVYVAAYSHVFTGPRANPYNLAITLAVRNTDLSQRIFITAIDYYDNNSKLVRKYAPSPIALSPLASNFTHLEEKDTSGGFAPKFIVKWEAVKQVTPPIIEAIMIGATSGQGISFVNQGQVIQER